MESQRRLQEKLSGDVERDRALFMKTPPVPLQKNLLLGQWRLVMPTEEERQCPSRISTRRFAGGVCETRLWRRHLGLPAEGDVRYRRTASAKRS